MMPETYEKDGVVGVVRKLGFLIAFVLTRLE